MDFASGPGVRAFPCASVLSPDRADAVRILRGFAARGGYTLGVVIEDSDALAAVAAIRGGDVAVLAALVEAEPALAGSRLGVAGGRTPLHIVSDWPGYFPNGPAIVALLVEAGANPNVRSDDDEHGETPLHWAASSDDVDVALALIEGGADLETPTGLSGRRSTTRSATAAGTWLASWSPEAPE